MGLGCGWDGAFQTPAEQAPLRGRGCSFPPRPGLSLGCADPLLSPGRGWVPGICVQPHPQRLYGPLCDTLPVYEHTTSRKLFSQAAVSSRLGCLGPRKAGLALGSGWWRKGARAVAEGPSRTQRWPQRPRPGVIQGTAGHRLKTAHRLAGLETAPVRHVASHGAD